MTEQKYLYKSLILKKKNFNVIYTYNYIIQMLNFQLEVLFYCNYLHSYKAIKTFFSALIILQFKYNNQIKMKIVKKQ